MWQTLLFIIGIVGGVLFYGRFYVQWYVSERKKQSVMPVAFWYMSAIGSVLLFAYSYSKVDPGATFGLCFNIVVYSRNLIHIWRERGRLTVARNVGLHLVAGLIAVGAVVLTALTWHHGFSNTKTFWIWSSVWGIGQALFFLRFFVQWLMTEMKKKSVVPPVFWHFSLVATVLQTPYYFHQGNLPMAIGMASNILVYARNLWFIYFGKSEEKPLEEAA